MMAFNRAFIEFGAAVGGLESARGVLELLWREWTNKSDGGAGWCHFGLDVLTRTRISAVNLKSDHLASPRTDDLLFRHDYGIDIVLRRLDAEPAYGGWINSTEIEVAARAVNGHRIIAARRELAVDNYAYDPSPDACVYRNEIKPFDHFGERNICLQGRKRPSPALKRARAAR